MKLVVYKALVNEEKKLIKDFNVYKCNLPFFILVLFEEEFRAGRFVFGIIKIFIPELILNYILCKAKSKSDMNM